VSLLCAAHVRLRSNQVATFASQSPRLAPPSAPGAGSGVASAVESCVVVRWRGYVTSCFYAVRSSDEAVVAVSDSFRGGRAAAPPENGAARAAYEDLKAELVALGWRDAGIRDQRGAWYAHRFERRVERVDSMTRVEPVAPAESPAPAPAPVPVAAPIAAVPSAARSGSDVAGAGAPLAPPPSQPARSRSRAWAIIAATVAGLVLVAAGGWGAVHAGVLGRPTPNPATEPRAPVVHGEAAKGAATAATFATPTVPAAAAAAGHLRVAGLGRGSWLEVRRGSAHGPVLFNGLVPSGRHMRFDGRRLWVMFGAATNLAVTVNGELQPLQGTVEGLITSRGLTAP